MGVKSDKKSLDFKDFTLSEIITIMDLALECLNDAEIFDKMVDQLDISDAAMCDLRDKIKKFMVYP